MAAYLVTVQARQAAAAPHILYLLDGELTTAHIQMLTAELLHDSVVQLAHWQALANLDEVAPAGFIEVAYKPGVTDTEIRLGLGVLVSELLDLHADLVARRPRPLRAGP